MMESRAPEHMRLAIRPSVGCSGRHYLTVRMELDGRPMSLTVECERDPGGVSLFCGSGLAQVGGLEIVERDWMAA